MKQNFVDFYNRMAAEMQSKLDSAETNVVANHFAKERDMYLDMAKDVTASMAKDFK